MKKYIQKLSNISSTTKLFFFIFILIVIVLFASSSIFIQYKNRQKSTINDAVETVALEANSKAEATPVVNSTPDTPESNPETNQESSPSNSASEIAPADACDTQSLKPPIIFKDAPWLTVGQTSITPGENGYIESCPRGSSSSKQPIPQIVYRGKKPLSEATSLLKNVVSGLKEIKI